MNKYLKPWIRNTWSNGRAYHRYCIGGLIWIAIVAPDSKSGYYWRTVDQDSIIKNGPKFSVSIEEAMKRADEQLIKDGFILLTEEQADKLEILV